MSKFGQRRLVCFYCSAPTSLTFDRSFNKFKCRSCDADNFLDQNGDITDPPVFISPDESPKRLQTTFTRPSNDLPLSPLGEIGSVVFCSTCQRNQQLLRAALSSYLPDNNHPRYKEFETAYPEYRSMLEQRYPQACAECQPKVSEHIRKAEYANRAMLLKSSIEKSKTARKETHSGVGQTMMWVLVNVGSLAWWASLLVQIGWNLLALRTDWNGGPQQTSGELPTRKLILDCTTKAFTSTISPQCFRYTENIAIDAIMVGILTLWWSPALHLKLRNPRLKLAGVGQHVILQVFVLGVRVLSWWMLKSPATLSFSAVAFRGAHAFGLLTMIMNIVLSRTAMFTTRHTNSIFRPKGQLVGNPIGKSSSSVSWDPLSLSQTPKKRVSKIPATPFPVSNLATSLPTDDLLKSSHYEQSDEEQSGSGVSDSDSDSGARNIRMNEDVMMDCSDDVTQPLSNTSASLFNRTPASFSLQRRAFGHPQDSPATLRGPPNTEMPSRGQFAPTRFQSNSPFLPTGGEPAINSFASPRSPRGLFDRRTNWGGASNGGSLGAGKQHSMPNSTENNNPFFTPRNPSSFSPARNGLRTAGPISKAESPKTMIPEAKLRLGNSGTGLEGMFNNAFSFQEEENHHPVMGKTPSKSPKRRRKSRAYENDSGSVSYYSARSVNLVVLVIGFLAVLLGMSGWVWSLAGRSNVVWVMAPRTANQDGVSISVGTDVVADPVETPMIDVRILGQAPEMGQ